MFYQHNNTAELKFTSPTLAVHMLDHLDNLFVPLLILLSTPSPHFTPISRASLSTHLDSLLIWTGIASCL